MAFQQQHPQRYDFITAETGDGMHMSQHFANPRKRKIHATGQSADVPHCCTSGGAVRQADACQLEIEAYTSVLRAFRFQADSISWEKESLITNLRQELRLSNDEHREILRRISMEDCYQMTRELCRACGDQYGVVSASNMSFNILPHTIAKGPLHKHSKKHSAIPLPSFGSSSAFYKQNLLTEGRKLYKEKKGGNVAGVLTNPVQYPSSGPNEMGKTAFNVSSSIFTSKASELAKQNYLLGKKVKIRVPHDHSFYKAVVSRYDPARGRHALSFNFAPGNDNLQWVDLTKIPPGDIQSDSEYPEMTTLPHCFRLSSTNASLAPEVYYAGPGKGIRIRKSRPKSDLLEMPGGSELDTSAIKIRLTDDLLRKIKTVFSAGNVDPYTVNDAKEVLKEHENALIQLLESLADVSDDE